MDKPKDFGDFGNMPSRGDELASSVIALFDLKKIQFAPSHYYDETGELDRTMELEGSDLEIAAATLALYGIEAPLKITIYQSSEQLPTLSGNDTIQEPEDYIDLSLNYGSFEIQYAVGRSEYRDTEPIAKRVESHEHSVGASAVESLMRQQEIDEYFRDNPLASPSEFIKDMIIDKIEKQPDREEEQAIIAMLKSVMEAC